MFSTVLLRNSLYSSTEITLHSQPAAKLTSTETAMVLEYLAVMSLAENRALWGFLLHVLGIVNVFRLSQHLYTYVE